MVAAQRIGGSRSDEDPGELAGGAPVAPNISNMSPRERVVRLYDRIVALNEQGNLDSARFIAVNMAIPAIRMMDSLDADLRYDLGRIGEMTGAMDVATAQADSILAEHPDHLLGLLLASRVARASGNEARARSLDQRLIAVERAERAKALPEYEAHAVDIDNALAEARRGGR
jgi:hypothetical protein